MRPACIIFIPVIALILCVGYIILRGCSGFVSMFDGELNRGELPITGKYFYYKKGRSMGKYIGGDHFITLFHNSRIDSVNWNADLIIGYTSGSYFAIIVKEDSIAWPIERDSVKKLSVKFNRELQSLPGVAGLVAF